MASIIIFQPYPLSITIRPTFSSLPISDLLFSGYQLHNLLSCLHNNLSTRLHLNLVIFIELDFLSHQKKLNMNQPTIKTLEHLLDSFANIHSNLKQLTTYSLMLHNTILLSNHFMMISHLAISLFPIHIAYLHIRLSLPILQNHLTLVYALKTNYKLLNILHLQNDTKIIIVNNITIPSINTKYDYVF